MGVSGGPKSIVDGLIYNIDPSNKRSYPGTGTTIFDLSGNNYTSYFANGALLADDVVRVDGVDDYISMPIFNLTAPVTVSAWVKNIVNEGIVFGSYNGGVYANAEYIFYYVGKTLIIQGNPGGAKTFQTPDLKLNAWVHLTMTRDAANDMRLYFNGVASSSNPQNYSVNLNLNQIGRYSNFSNQYNLKGSIGEVRIYNRALSSTEVLQYYNSTKLKYNVVENITSNSLILNYDFNNPNSYVGTGTTVINIAGVGSTATLINGPTFSHLNGGSVAFDGSDDGMIFPSPNFATSDFTMDVWVRLNGYPPTANAAILVNRDTNDNGWLLDINSNKKGRLVFQNNAGTQYIIETIDIINLSQWTNLTAIRSDTTLSFYRNGIFQTSTSFPSNYSINSPIANDYVGRYQSPNGYLNANVSNIKYYNRALSSTEVLQNYNATKNRYIRALPAVTSGLVLNLDAGSRASYVGVGTSWYDLSNSGLNSTLVGSPTFAGTGTSGYFVFDSNTKSATFNTSLLSGYSAGTIECSVYITNLSSSFIMARQRNGFNSYNVFSIGSYADGGGTLATGTSGIIYYHNKNAQTVLSSSTVLQINTWYRLAITFTTSAVILYINGVQDATVAGDYSVPSDTSTDPRVGAWIKDGTNYPMNGRLAQVQIYNRALTASEILQNFNAYRTRYGI